jgi:hypothetical protein
MQIQKVTKYLIHIHPRQTVYTWLLLVLYYFRISCVEHPEGGWLSRVHTKSEKPQGIHAMHAVNESAVFQYRHAAKEPTVFSCILDLISGTLLPWMLDLMSDLSPKMFMMFDSYGSHVPRALSLYVWSLHLHNSSRV